MVPSMSVPQNQNNIAPQNFMSHSQSGLNNVSRSGINVTQSYDGAQALGLGGAGNLNGKESDLVLMNFSMNQSVQEVDLTFGGGALGGPVFSPVDGETDMMT